MTMRFCRGRKAAFFLAVPVLAAAVLAGSACVSNGGGKARIIPAAETARVGLARELAAKGDYLSLKKAVVTYEELLAVPGIKEHIAGPYIEASLLLDLRKKTLGLLDGTVLEGAQRLTAGDRSLGRYAAMLTVASCLGARTRAVLQDINMSFWNKQRREELDAAAAELRRTWRDNETAAVLLMAHDRSFGLYKDEKVRPAEITDRYPDSVFVLYQAAVSLNDGAAMERLLARFPVLVELRYYQGELALERGLLLEAEKHLRAAEPAVPDSPHIPMFLAGIRFALEEFEASLTCYDGALALAPNYRDAMLGKAISLGYLGRHDEAMVMLEKLLALDLWLIGESHYWMAWNLHEQGVREGALAHIEEAMKRLPTDSEVFCLAGKLASEGGEPAKAEKYFVESLVHNNGNSDSLFGLGGVMAKSNRWAEAAGYYEKAAEALDKSGREIERKIAEIQDSPLEEGRKASALARKRKQLEKTVLMAAVSCFDGAAASVNAGDKKRARDLSGKAAGHEAVKAKAEGLLKSLD